MGNVIDWHGITKHDLPPDRLLNAALDKLESVVIIGFDKDGDEYFASSLADGGDVLWLMERAKIELLRTVYEGIA